MSVVARDSVVSIALELSDAQGVRLHGAEEPLTYLHGGYGALLEALEAALEGKRVGDTVQLQLEPEHAFGDYDTKLLRVESSSRYGDGLEIGMQVEDAFGGEAPRLYTVTDLAEGKVVLDGNHPFAGMALRFFCRVLAVRAATSEEIRRGAPDAP